MHFLGYVLVFVFVWEIIDRIKSSRRHSAEQWSKEEREILESQGSPPLKINRIYPIAYLENELRISETDSIESEIALEFYRNLEHKDDYIQSVAEYNGKKVYIIFYDWRQNPLRHLANYFYKKEVTNENYI